MVSAACVSFCAITVGLVGVGVHWWPVAAGFPPVAAILAACTLAVAVTTALGRNRPAPAAVPVKEQVAYALETLATLVQGVWRDEARLRGLDETIPVRWKSAPRNLVDHRHKVRAGSELSASSDNIDGLANRFRALPAKRLVILGEAGSGKTSLAVQLLLEMLRQRRPGDFVPVYVTISEWDIEQFPRLKDWVAFRIRNDFAELLDISAGVVDELVSRNYILPVIDGLDELEVPHRLAVFRTIQETLDPDGALILACRTAEYRHLVRELHVIKRSAGIESQALTVTQVIGYLTDCLPPELDPDWQSVFNATIEGKCPALATVCSTALGLWLVRVVYVEQKRSPLELLTDDYRAVADLKRHLYSQLVPVLVALGDRRRREGDSPFAPKRTWSAPDVTRWLGFLAGGLGAERDFAWWRLPTAVSGTAVRWSAAFLGWRVAALTIGIVWFVCGLSATLGHFDVVASVLSSSIVAVVLSLVAFIPFYFVVVKPKNVRFTKRPSKVNWRLRGRVQLLGRRSVEAFPGVAEVAVVTAVVGGCAAGLFYGVWSAVKVGLVVFLAFVAILTAALGIINWAAYSDTETAVLTPDVEYRNARRSALIEAISLGAGFSLTFLIGGMVAQPVWLWIPVSLSFGLMIGCLSAADPTSSPWVAYLAAERVLAREKQIPRRFLGFLGDCRALGLLRAAGPLFEFRHAELQDYLSQSAEFGTRTSLAPPPVGEWQVSPRSNRLSNGEIAAALLLQQNSMEEIRAKYALVGPGVYMGVLTRMVILSRDDA